jgi:hypothetical protein
MPNLIEISATVKKSIITDTYSSLSIEILQLELQRRNRAQLKKSSKAYSYNQKLGMRVRNTPKNNSST